MVSCNDGVWQFFLVVLSRCSGSVAANSLGPEHSFNSNCLLIKHQSSTKANKSHTWQHTGFNDIVSKQGCCTNHDHLSPVLFNFELQFFILRNETYHAQYVSFLFSTALRVSRVISACSLLSQHLSTYLK